MSATNEPGGTHGGSPGRPPDGKDDGAVTFDRQLVIEQLGGWRGMVDATLPTLAFVVANSTAGLRTGIWAALGAALLVFVFRLVRRESVQQALSGLFAVGIAVAIASASGQARDFFVLGIVRNAVIGVVLLGSVAVRRPLVGVIAEFLAPSHLGGMAAHSLGLRRKPAGPAPERARGAEHQPERHWRDDPRMLRAYSWLTVLWAATFLLRVLVQGPLYRADEVELLGTASLLLGLPVTAVAGVVTLVVVSRLHRHRSAGPAGGSATLSPEQDPEPVTDDDLRGPLR
jgi:hypothetical protein